MNAAREGIKAAKEEADRLGATAQVVRHGKHVVIEVSTAHGASRFPLSGTPRSDGHKDWARQKVRRALKSIRQRQQEKQA